MTGARTSAYTGQTAADILANCRRRKAMSFDYVIEGMGPQEIIESGAPR
jgi:hypothetical protein